MKYRKKPVIVEAVQWTGNDRDMSRFLGTEVHPWPQHPNILDYDTVDAIIASNQCCRMKDWAVKGPSGTVYVVRQDAFKAEYEPIP